MQVDGELKSAGLECLSSAPANAPRARMYADIASGVVPKIKDATRWAKFLTDNTAKAVKTANYTLTLDDEVVFADASSASFALTLPTAASAVGKRYKIVRTDGTAATIGFFVTVTPNTGAETIDGSTTFKLCTKNDAIEILSDGSIWRLISHTYDQSWVAFTPTGSWTSNTTYNGFFRRVGDCMELDIQLTLAGAPTSAALTLDLPNAALSLDTAKMAYVSSAATPLGEVIYRDASAVDKFLGLALFNSSTSTATLACFSDDGDGTISAATQAVPVTFATTDRVLIRARGLPITNWR